MKRKSLNTLWGRNHSIINGWLSIPSSFVAESMALLDYDSITIDLQHGMIDYQTMIGMLQAISTTETVPIVRVPWLDPGLIMKVLDAGAYGIICPMINTKQDAENFVAFTTYAPAGKRSYGPIRAQLYGGQDYWEKANETITRFAMIETREALENLEAILTVKGLDAVYVGPSDLALSLGSKPGFDDLEAHVQAAVARIAISAKKAGVRAGIHCGSVDSAMSRLHLGFDFVTIGSDSRYMASAANGALIDIRSRLNK